MKNVFYSALIFISFALLTGCEEPYTGPRIEWLSNQGHVTETFQYSSGVISGINVFARFEAVDGSGLITIICKTGNSESALEFDIEEGKSYKIKASCGISPSGSKSVILESEAAENDHTHQVSANKVLIRSNGLSITEL